MNQVGVALVGYGTIGCGVIEILQDQMDLIFKRSGVRMDLTWVIDKDLTTPRRVPVKKAKTSSNYQDALKDPNTQIIIELVGGVGFAYTLIEESLKAGKNVVTANKALLAEKGTALFQLAKEKRLAIGFEASVCGGIPIIRTISEALIADNIRSINAIVNGTTNYILTKMFEENQNFSDALAQAQKLGFAEADPTLDIGGHDAAHKAAILASMAFNTVIDYDHVHTEGINKIELEDVRNAQQLGYVIKLLAIAKLDPDNTVEVRVNPTLVPINNQLASVRNEYNAVLVDSDFLGQSMYFGKGAGSKPTATAVVADIVDTAMFINEVEKTTKLYVFNNYPLKPIGDIESRYYLRFLIMDKPGVLSNISGIFAQHNISIASVIQKERSETDYVPLIMTTHSAQEKNILKALDEIEHESYNKSRGVLIRILD